MPKGKSAKQVTGSKSSTTSAKPIPSPYVLAPDSLAGFLDSLDPKHIYITHIDIFPADFKRKIFIVPFLLNIAITAAIIWRACYIAPYYFALLCSVLGYYSPLNVDTSSVNFEFIAGEAFGRTGVFLIDAAIIKLVLPWPYEFFIAQTGPFSWRRKLGFQPREVVVRRSRRWDQDLPANWLENANVSSVYTQRIMPAIDQKWMRTKTGYLMLDRSWDLDFALMTVAHKLIESRDLNFDHFEKSVYVHSEELGWLVWQVHRLDESVDDVGRAKIVQFKDKLTEMGQESLFYRWVELIQFHSSGPEGFTEKRQADAMKQARELFEQRGVDFDKFWIDVGGLQGMPGLETNS